MVAVAFALLIAAPAGGAENAIGNIILADGKHLQGVEVRRLPSHVVFAAPEGVQQVPIGRISVSPGMIAESMRINELLNLMAQWVVSNSFLRVENDLGTLRSMIADFEQRLQPQLNSAVVSARHKDALRHAVNYYREEYGSLEPTIALLKLAAAIQTLREQHEAGQAVSDEEALHALIAYQRALNSIPEYTPLARKERVNSHQILGDLMTATVTRLQDKVLEAYSDTLKPEPVVSLLQTLAKGAGVSPLIDIEQARLLEGIITVASNKADQLPEVSKQILLLDAAGQLQFSDDAYNELRQTVERTIFPGLAMIRDATFGEGRQQHVDRLDTMLASYRQALDETAQRVLLLRQVKQLYDDGWQHNQGKRFGRAAETFAQASEALKEAGMEESAVATGAIAEQLRNQALQIQDNLIHPERFPREELQSLIDSSSDFIDQEGKQLTALGISVRQLRGDVDAVRRYELYLRQYDELRALRHKEPLKAWNLVLELGAAVEAAKGTLPAAAISHWEAFLSNNREAIFREASEDLEKRGEGLADEHNQAIYISFVDKFIHDGEYMRAAESIQKVLQQLDSRQIGESLGYKLLSRKMEIAQRYEEQGDLTTAMSVYASLLDEPYTTFATRHNVNAQLARARLKLAEQQVAAGSITEAIANYEEIALSAPQFAETHQLVARILSLASRQYTNVHDPLDSPELMQVYDRYSQRFPGRLRLLPPVQVLGKKLVGILNETWQDGKSRQALALYRGMHEQYPGLTEEIQLHHQLLIIVRNHLHNLTNPTNTTPEAAAATVSTDILDTATDVLSLPELADNTQLPVTQQKFVSLMMNRAENYLALGQVERAFTIYEQLQRDFPAIAEERNISQLRDDKQWELRMEKIRLPLRIRGGLDWAALVAWIAIWSSFFVFAIRRGRERDELEYRLHHFFTVFCVFLLFLVASLLSDISHANSFALAFVLPGILFNGYGCTTYRFFPLVYYERRLMLERALLWVLSDTPLNTAASETARRKLAAHARELANMVALMNDRKLFAIHVAMRRSERDPVKGSLQLQSILQELEQTPAESRDAIWNKHHAMVVHQLGMIAHLQGNSDKARHHLTAYIEHNPKDVDVRQIVGDLAYQRQDYEEAIPHLKVSLAVNGQDEQLWYKLGRCFFETEKYVSAYKCFEAAKHKDRDILYWGARAFGRAGEGERAAKWYQALLKKYPNDSEAIYYLASTFAEMGQHLKALKVAAVIKSDDPCYPSALTLQGNILFKRDELQKAEVFYTKALELNPDFAPALVGIGQIHLSKNDGEAALASFKRIVELKPEDPAGNYFLGVLLQEKAPERAIDHLKKAVTEPAFRRWASRRIGYIAFFRSDSDTSLHYFAIAEDAGESSPWFLFLYAYSLAARRELRRCEQTLIKILGRTAQSKDWSAETATRAMYSIGVMLFEQHAYKMAHQCFEFVSENPLPDAELRSVADFVEEARFRMVINWLEQGEYVEAQARCAELQLEAKDKARYQSCQYYLALCQLFQGQYADAASLLSSLIEADGANARYRYHLIIAELGCGHEQQAREAMNSFSGMSDRPDHLTAGLVTIQAFMNARRGKIQDAERSLARVSLPAGETAGDAYLRDKILLARIYYLCQLQDHATIATLAKDLPDEKRSKALYMQAIACLQNNDHQQALEFMRPFADQSERDRKLFTYLAAQGAIRHLKQNQLKEAKLALRDIAKPPREVVTILNAWDISDQLQRDENLLAPNDLIDTLTQDLGKMEDEYLNYFILHNLAVLHLRRAYQVENEIAGDETKRDNWQRSIDFWYQFIFANPSYWNLAQARFSDDDNKLRPFANEDIEKINQACKDQLFVNAFIGQALHCLSAGDEVGTQRHLHLLRIVADKDNKLKVYYRRLGEKVEQYLRGIDKTNPVWNSWEFTIASLSLQVQIADVLGLDHDNAQSQLELYRTTRTIYATPADYQRAKRQFNTELLEAVQVGVRGSFSEAGDLIDKILASIPPGVDLEKLNDNLRLLREACRNPAAYAERGINLSQQFEKAYATARTINLNKPKSDGNTR